MPSILQVMEQPKVSVPKGLSAKLISGIVIVAALLIVAMVSLTVFKVANVNSFESCAAKYPVMESYPERCRTPDGRLFTKQVP